MNPGYLIAFLTILLYGSWPVPTKTLKIDPQVQAFWLTVGHLIISIVIFLFVIQPIPLQNLFWPTFAGIIWAIGITCAYVAIKNLGVTRAVGIWIPIIIVVSTLGVFLFKEVATARGKLFIALSIAIAIAGILTLNSARS